MTAAEPLGHDDLDALVLRLKLAIEASELHGSLCGYLAGGGSLAGTTVLAALHLEGDDVSPSSADRELLQRLARQCADELADPELGFELLLPADDRRLDERAEALVDWCRGFLGGFGLAGAGAHGKLSAEAQEVLRDMGTIAATALDFGEQSEDEDALIEVTEFVRMGALLLHAECASAAGPGSQRVH